MWYGGDKIAVHFASYGLTRNGETKTRRNFFLQGLSREMEMVGRRYRIWRGNVNSRRKSTIIKHEEVL